MMKSRRNSSNQIPRPGSEILERLAFQNAPDVLLLIDADGSVLDANRQACALLGWPLEDLLHLSLADLDADFDSLADLARLRFLKPDQPLALDRTWKRKDGVRFPVDVRIGLVRPGQSPAYLAVVRDVSSRRRLEAELHQAQKMEALGRLAGGVSHDFNNLLTAIIGYSELSLVGAADPTLRESLEEIRRAGERAAALTRQLLAFSRRQAIRPRAIDLSAATNELSGLLRRLIPESIRIELKLGEKIGLVRADPGHVDQVVLNLALNARDAMLKGGALGIATSDVELTAEFARAHPGSAAGSYVLLAVTDTGHGIPKDVLPHIFEPFFTTKSAGKGTGLGLATVYGIVKQNGGFISYSTQEGKGTTFRVYFPRLAAGERIGRDSQVIETIGGTENILLVEDDPVVRAFVVQCLRQNGYRVTEAADPEQALGLADRPGAAFHLLLTDMVMPGMSGRDLARRLRERVPSLPIVYMTGYTEDAALQEGRLEPGSGFIAKPFTPVQLLTRIRKTLLARSPLSC